VVQRPNGNITSVPSERGSQPAGTHAHPPREGSASESARIPVDIRRFPWIRKLAADYAFAYSSLSQFFSGDPASASAWVSAISRAQQYSRPRAELSRLVIAQQDRRHAPPAARASASLLADPRTVAIVTGQQAGLFGGPLYTLFKALTSVKLAERVAKEHHVPTVAIFWIEAEDHDWDEVASCSVLDGDLQRRTITLPRVQGAGEAPIGLIKFGSEIETAIGQLASTLPQTEFTTSLLTALQKSYASGIGMADAFARWLEHLIGELGIIVFDCADPAAKPLAAPLFTHEIQHAGRTWQLAGEAGDQLVARGYHAQVTRSPQDGTALFRLNGGRMPVHGDEPSRLVEDVRSRPETFSPNVLLRPVIEDALFPTVCYVSGPNELAYLAQLRKVYEHFGVPMPLLFPRLSATVLDSASGRFLAKYDLPLEALQARDEAALNRLLAASLPESVDKSLEEADQAIERSMNAIISAVPAVDPTLEGAARSTLGKLEHDLTTLRGKVISAAKKRDETLRRQFFRAQAQAFPDGLPQERAIGSISMLNRYGPALVQTLVTDLPLDIGHHWILTL
jgi:bacillithiol biosynthesis cysteine-adding enzyme BshC